MGLCPICLFSSGLEDSSGDEFAVCDEGHVSLRHFGNYELVAEIARGGMGVVYRARQAGLNRLVAVKLLLYGPWSSPGFIKRFRAEAAAAASLSHPNIVAIHEVGEHEGQHYFSMDLVEGSNLADLIAGTPVASKTAARLLESIAKAIDHAHQKGILHRDLKPSNILVDADGQPRVTDFGLARQLDARRDAELTTTGQLIGSPAYMSPEQIRSGIDRIGPASDVYSLGAVLFHLLTGRPPFVAGTLHEVLRQATEEEPIAPRRLNASVPWDLDTICLKCLEKDPSARYATARELAEELGRYVRDEPIRARPIGRATKSWRWCRRNPMMAGLTGALVIVVLAGFAGVARQWQRAEQNAAAARAGLVRLSLANGNRLIDEGHPAASLPWLVEALRLDAGDPDREAAHRVRLGLVLNDLPRLRRVLAHQDPVLSAQFSAEDREIIITTGVRLLIVAST